MGEASYEKITTALEHIRTKTDACPKIGIVCGSGLGGIGELVTDSVAIPYKDIPGFHASSVRGHKGQLLVGKMNGVQVVCMQGRVHGYEGIPFSKVAFPIRVMKMMGVETLLTTAAAGAVNQSYKLGDFMILRDHLPLAMWACNGPLTGPNDDKFGPRFPPMSNAYSSKLIKMAQKTFKDLGQADKVQLGCYICGPGPQYETIAELRFYQTVGGDMAGMSIAAEVIVARHCDMECFGVAMATNVCSLEYDSNIIANHAEVIEVANARAKDMETFVTEFVSRIDADKQATV